MDRPNPTAVKNSLLNAPWKRVGTMTLEGAAGPVTLVIRRPPPKIAAKLLKSCEADGLADAEGRPTSPEHAITLAARLHAPMLYLEGASEPLFTPDEFTDLPDFQAACEACQAALSVTGQIEAAKGN